MTRELTISITTEKGNMYKIALNIVISWTLMNSLSEIWSVIC